VGSGFAAGLLPPPPQAAALNRIGNKMVFIAAVHIIVGRASRVERARTSQYMRSLQFAVVVLLTSACAKSAPSTTPIKDPVPMAEGPKEPAATPATAMLAAYERVRALLAADELEGVGAAAREIEATANAASYTAIATNAAKLAGAADLEAARVSFADVSRDVVTLLASDKALAKGQHVFECPMVQGYRKWVQPSQDLENPYMGKKMLACGGESTWE